VPRDRFDNVSGRWQEDAGDGAVGVTPIAKTFPVVRVTPRVHQLIRDLEEAQGVLYTSPDSEVLTAYGFVTRARQPLYQYIEALEKKLGIKRTVQLRFN
jgi:hypothetical protein